MSLPLREHGAPRLQHPLGRGVTREPITTVAAAVKTPAATEKFVLLSGNGTSIKLVSLSPAVDTENNQDELFTAGDL